MYYLPFTFKIYNKDSGLNDTILDSLSFSIPNPVSTGFVSAMMLFNHHKTFDEGQANADSQSKLMYFEVEYFNQHGKLKPEESCSFCLYKIEMTIDNLSCEISQKEQLPSQESPQTGEQQTSGEASSRKVEPQLALKGQVVNSRLKNPFFC